MVNVTIGDNWISRGIMKHEKKAIHYLSDGYSCSEAILAAYAEEHGLDSKIAFKIAGGFGGGMASGETCGAITSSFMVIGLTCGAGVSKDSYYRDLTYQLVQEFYHRFHLQEGATTCKGLLALNNVDIRNPQQMKKLRETGLCKKMVITSVGILEELFQEHF